MGRERWQIRISPHLTLMTAVVLFMWLSLVLRHTKKDWNAKPSHKRGVCMSLLAATFQLKHTTSIHQPCTWPQECKVSSWSHPGGGTRERACSFRYVVSIYFAFPCFRNTGLKLQHLSFSYLTSKRPDCPLECLPFIPSVSTWKDVNWNMKRDLVYIWNVRTMFNFPVYALF